MNYHKHCLFLSDGYAWDVDDNIQDVLLDRVLERLIDFAAFGDGSIHLQTKAWLAEVASRKRNAATKRDRMGDRKPAAIG